jgi:hypothetical protein
LLIDILLLICPIKDSHVQLRHWVTLLNRFIKKFKDFWESVSVFDQHLLQENLTIDKR